MSSGEEEEEEEEEEGEPVRNGAIWHFVAEREIEMEGEIKREWDKESQRGKQKMVLSLKHNLKRHDGFCCSVSCVCVFWQGTHYVIYLNDTACPHETHTLTSTSTHTHTHTQNKFNVFINGGVEGLYPT